MKKSLNNSQAAYNILARNYVNWTRLNMNHIQVATPGYCGAECLEMERELRSAGMHATRRSYDRKLGKTITIYKMVVKEAV